MYPDCLPTRLEALGVQDFACVTHCCGPNAQHCAWHGEAVLHTCCTVDRWVSDEKVKSVSGRDGLPFRNPGAVGGSANITLLSASGRGLRKVCGGGRTLSLTPHIPTFRCILLGINNKVSLKFCISWQHPVKVVLLVRSMLQHFCDLQAPSLSLPLNATER